MGFKSLRITCLEAEEDVEGACDSSLGRDTPLDDLGFPVEILPHLFLGNAKNSGDRDALNRHKIRVSFLSFFTPFCLFFPVFGRGRKSSWFTWKGLWVIGARIL